MPHTGEATDNHFEHVVAQSWPTTIQGVGRAAYTLFNVPEHDSSLYEDIGKILAPEPQPTHAPIDQEVAAVLAGPAQLIDIDRYPKATKVQLLGHLGLFMQFSSYLPKLQPFGQTPFKHVDNLYEEIAEKGSKAPLSYADQLTIGLNQTKGDLPEAMWRLFLTSRQHARWFDGSLMPEMPEMTRDEKLERMHTFARSVLACKPYKETPVQDSAGDTYYTWTHALGGLMFESLAKQSIATRIVSKIIHNGTTLMHSLAHRYKPQRLISDHSVAANYGNAIGNALVGVVNDTRRASTAS